MLAPAKKLDKIQNLSETMGFLESESNSNQ
jgi:hypothetical protein